MPGPLPPRPPTRRVAAALAWMMSAAALACSDSSDGGRAPSEVTVRDSAGVQIVENAIPEDAAPTIVTAGTPSLAIGAVEGDEAQQLHQVRDALRLPGGRVALLNGGSHEVRIYGADGSLDLAFGRKGGGPSEFAGFPYQLDLLPPDTLVIWDFQTWETSWFLADGTFIRKEPGRTAYETHMPEGRTAEGGWAAPGRGLLLKAWEFGAEQPSGEVYVPSMELMFIGSDGEARVLGDFGGPEQMMTLGEDGRFSSSGVLFGKTGMVEFGGRPPRVWAGRNDRFELRQFTADGQIERVIRVEQAPRAVTSADVDRLIAQIERSMRANGAPPEAVESQLARARDAPVAESMPLFGSIFVTHDGGAWVGRITGPRGEDEPPRPARYDVFGPDGRWLGVAETPPGLRPLEIGADYVLGVRQDDLGVEFVELYGLDDATPTD